MSQKKRGSNPIRITLTEDQISDIIQSAAKTRRGLKVESLEDRIAPSAIGAPMFGDVPDGPPSPPPPIEPPNPEPGFIEPLAGETPPGYIEPLPGEHAPGYIEPLAGEHPPGYIEPLAGEQGGPLAPPAPPAPPAPDSLGEQPSLHAPGSDVVPDANDAPQPHVPTPGNDPAPPVNPTDSTGAGQMPTSDEIEEHRRNILRQLRGN